MIRPAFRRLKREIVHHPPRPKLSYPDSDRASNPQPSIVPQKPDCYQADYHAKKSHRLLPGSPFKAAPGSRISHLQTRFPPLSGRAMPPFHLSPITANKSDALPNTALQTHPAAAATNAAETSQSTTQRNARQSVPFHENGASRHPVSRSGTASPIGIVEHRPQLRSIRPLPSARASRDVQRIRSPTPS